MSYDDLMIWQYKNKPRARETVKMYDFLCKEYHKLIAEFPTLFCIDTAAGYHLDVIGNIVGISRVVHGYNYRSLFGFTRSKQALGFSVSGLGGGRWWRYGFPLADDVFLKDDDFRWLIRTKIYRNNQRGDVPYLAQTCAELLGQGVEITDNYNMTVSIRIPTTDLNDFKNWALLNMDVLPRPIGVQYLLSTYNK